MSINWNELRPWNGSQYSAFEELCCQLAEYEQAQQGTKFFRKGTPDAGVECYRLLSNGDEWGWQAKFFLHPPTAGEWQQVDDSVKTALEKHPSLTRYYVCLPIDRPDARIPEQQSFMNKWKEHVEKWRSWAGEKQMSVEFEYWGEHEISTRLSLEDHRGRYFFWFKKESFSQKWFDGHIAEAIADAGPRYTPELNVELPISGLFEGLGRTSEFFTGVKILRGKLVREYAKLRRVRPTESGGEAFNNLLEGINRLLPLLVQAEEAGAGQIDLKRLLAAASESMNHAWDLQKILREIEERAKHTATSQNTVTGDATSKGDKPREDFGYLIHHLQELSRALSNLVDYFSSSAAKLANVGALMVVGNAGTGKTHLFCDVAKRRIAAGLPTVLLLGQHFSSGEPWSQTVQLWDSPGTSYPPCGIEVCE